MWKSVREKGHPCSIQAGAGEGWSTGACSEVSDVPRADDFFSGAGKMVRKIRRTRSQEVQNDLMSETSETSNSDVHLAGQPNFASHPMKWVKSRLLKLDLRSFDWSSASFGHWILVYRMSECIVHTCGHAAHSLSASEWPLTMPRRWRSTCFVCARKIFFRSNLTSISYRFNSSWNIFIVGYLGRLSLENWRYLKPPGSSEFFLIRKTVSSQRRRTVSGCFSSPLYVWRLGGCSPHPDSKTRNGKKWQQLFTPSTKCILCILCLYSRDLRPTNPLPMSTLYINHELTHIGTVLHVRRDHDTGLSFSRKMLGIVQA